MPPRFYRAESIPDAPNEHRHRAGGDRHACLNRRTLLLGAAPVLFMRTPAPAQTLPFRLDPKYEPQMIRFSDCTPGTIVVDPQNRFLCFVESPGFATRHGVGVGRAGLEFKGAAVVGRKAKWPSWRPTDAMIRRSPEK